MNTKSKIDDRWTPPPHVVTHWESSLDSNLDFSIAPPLEIGEIKTAWSSFVQGRKSRTNLKRIMISVGFFALVFTLSFGFFVWDFFATLTQPSPPKNNPLKSFNGKPQAPASIKNLLSKSKTTRP